MTKRRSDRATALEHWADEVQTGDLVEADTDDLQVIAGLADQRDEVERALVDAVRAARRANRSWSEIGAMLGVSKQAAQQRYSPRASA